MILPKNAPVLVVGAGIMGAGIAQVAAQAGHSVYLFDMREGAAAQAKLKLTATLESLVAKGKISADVAQATLACIEPVESLNAAADAMLVIEAIVENLDAKRSLFRQLESVVGDNAILASNTSSISVTAIANGLQRPGRFVGMHFFNPVPQMKLVEVVSGLQTDAAVAQAIDVLSVAWGKVPVHARSTPGFIVNRIARPYYAETLALLQEQAATPQALDACLKTAGFRMGPCELMDLIGHDTNFAVTNSVFEANFGDKRFVPSLVQRELVDGGLLGRKSGRGFYTYPEGASAQPSTTHEAPIAVGLITVHGVGEIADQLEQFVSQGQLCGDDAPARRRQSAWVGLEIGSARLVLTDGRTASDIAKQEGLSDVVVFDRPTLWPASRDGALAYAVAPQVSGAWRQQAPAWLAALGFVPIPLADAPGLVVTRTIAMLINEAADAVLQGVCTTDGADAAMKLGVNYPAGPFEWLSRWSVAGVIHVLESLDEHYRGERYRVSPWLRRYSA
ncbi:MAG TPA: 3-hydroxyacyl-CoA dehydrogenase [Hydrogenophaga sp.]|uniref:3-hydroxyacyl-CoA dehydrogenase n=1 Tax=Hydrogenophaga sp. TaxID=1904254 RepID=UPI0008AB3ECD|nr:3-hydroxyacyl-CoA dehydrogenase [Hydrogenophaga sp.]OGA76188.1 MAG: 3-hydroxyacyl-CoA dehydrogenase [Burkholderiales bacterium GWE1_65_30]OGA91152.1 MAG: 3-hydroxyacyl-CoA dehydrogenase [Burkholderiales bacterium GWF1_66_17]HAX23403.1 3-hydroxyacyl-CoA dehydrogenase [Hydrogenophaga sp.]